MHNFSITLYKLSMALSIGSWAVMSMRESYDYSIPFFIFTLLYLLPSNYSALIVSLTLSNCPSSVL